MILSNVALDPTSAPTLFELSMANGLSASLRPAFDYAINVFANRGHSWALIAGTRRAELFGLAMLGIERHYLNEYESSFTENFYGLKRRRSDGNPMTPHDKLTSLLELVLFPYLRVKSDHLNSKPLQHVWAFYETFNLLYQFAYLFGKTKFFSPLLRWQNIVLARITGDDVRKFSEREAAASVTWSANKTRFVFQGITSTIRYTIIFSVVILKLFEHYSSPESRALREAQQRRFGGMAAPPPPQPLMPLPESAQLVINPKLCPLCGEVRQNPALSTSGYCFCYNCIHTHVERYQRCPVTGTPCTLLDIRKIYAT